jgi:CMP-N,N'-diacetyllegionaminic acid synthase
MFDNKTILAIIPARGGSKGILRKNLRLIKGQSLLAHAINAAKRSPYLDKLIVSSEDAEIIAEAKRAGAEVPFVRPETLAQDNTSGIAPILHALEQLPNYDYFIVLQPTSPLRITADIDHALTHLIRNNAPACVSVCAAAHHPQWIFQLSDAQQLQHIMPGEIALRRQDLPKAYCLNGAIYAAKTAWFCEYQQFLTDETLAYIMPQERSVDIDTEYDLRLAEVFMDDQHD